MSRLLYVRLKEKQSFEFGIPVEHSGFKEVFDLDNFSDAHTVASAVKFISVTEETTVVIDAKPLASFGKLLYLFNFMKEQNNISLEIIGEHKMLGFLRN